MINTKYNTTLSDPTRDNAKPANYYRLESITVPKVLVLTVQSNFEFGNMLHKT
jgi:hypothetical protein